MLSYVGGIGLSVAKYAQEFPNLLFIITSSTIYVMHMKQVSSIAQLYTAFFDK